MSEQEFKAAKSSLAFSQGLIDRLRGEQAPVASEMPQEATIEPEVVEETAIDPETPQEPISGATEETIEEPQEESRLERMFGDFMATMDKFFKREQEKEEVSEEAEEPEEVQEVSEIKEPIV